LVTTQGTHNRGVGVRSVSKRSVPSRADANEVTALKVNVEGKGAKVVKNSFPRKS